MHDRSRSKSKSKSGSGSRNKSRSRACPTFGILSASPPPTSSSVVGVDRIKLAAYESLRQDDASRTDPRLFAAGRHFLECDGIGTLQRLVGRRDRRDEHVVADDARRPTRSLHRNAFPLASFLSLHVASQHNRLGAAVGRRMRFGKLGHGRSVTAVVTTQPQTTATASVRSSRGSMRMSTSSAATPTRRGRVRSSWHVSPLMFRVIVAFTKILTQQDPGAGRRASRMVGGRHLGTGRNGTRVYTFDDIAREHPRMRRLCMHMYSSHAAPSCFMGRDASHVLRLVESSVSDIPTPFLAQLALKDVTDMEDAGTEIHLHQRIHRWFSEVHCIHLTCLHPHVHFLELDEKADVQQQHQGTAASGDRHRLLVNRLLEGDVHHLILREGELTDLAIAVLHGLEIFHAHHYLHMDIKPDNILWELDAQRSRRQFCLSDYNLVLSEAQVQQYLRPDDGGGFQSLSHGTEGYKSPLLMLDDVKDTTYSRFDLVALRSRAFVGSAHPVWREYFDRARAETTMAKVDLHGLALTLVRLASPQGQDKAETARLLRGTFGKFVARLMFFRPHDFSTAAEALEHLMAQNPVAAAKAESNATQSNLKRKRLESQMARAA